MLNHFYSIFLIHQNLVSSQYIFWLVDHWLPPFKWHQNRNKWNMEKWRAKKDLQSLVLHLRFFLLCKEKVARKTRQPCIEFQPIPPTSRLQIHNHKSSFAWWLCLSDTHGLHSSLHPNPHLLKIVTLSCPHQAYIYLLNYKYLLTLH